MLLHERLFSPLGLCCFANPALQRQHQLPAVRETNHFRLEASVLNCINQLRLHETDNERVMDCH